MNKSKYTRDEQLSLLRDDVRNELQWILVGAIAWEAARNPSSDPRNLSHHQGVLAMSAVAVHARALYDFFFATPGRNRDLDDARVSDFGTWSPAASPSREHYMSGSSPAQKRFFHLVYRRGQHSGGTGQSGPDHLKEQVLEFAKDLLKICVEFAASLTGDFQAVMRTVVSEAWDEAQKAATAFGITNPFPRP